jgi:DNA-binding transcriptional ArsR family regulator
VIRVRLSRKAGDQVGFSYSPLTECVLSLRVPRQRKRHPLHQPWARMMQRLPDSLLGAIDRFGSFVRDDPRVAVLAAASGPGEFSSELESFRSLPTTEIRYHLSWSLHRGALQRSDLERAGVRRRLVESSSTGRRPSHRLLVLAMEQPEAFLSAFSEVLERYFEEAFATEWERIEPLLAANAIQTKRRIADDGFYETFERLSPRLGSDQAARQILIDDPLDGDAALRQGDLLVLAPSVYAWPDVIVFVEPAPWPRRIVYPTPLLAAWSIEPPPPGELQQLLHALGNHTRLSALRLIAQKPRTTQGLAPLLGVSEATLSRHLRILAEVGALSRHRDGRFVRYALEAQRLAQLEPGLLHYLHAPRDQKGAGAG